MLGKFGHKKYFILLIKDRFRNVFARMIEYLCKCSPKMGSKSMIRVITHNEMCLTFATVLLIETVHFKHF